MQHAFKLLVIGVASVCLHRRLHSRRQRSRRCAGPHELLSGHGLASSQSQQTVLTPLAPELPEPACFSSPPATCGVVPQHLLEAEALPEHQLGSIATTLAFTVTGPAMEGPLTLQTSDEHTGCSSSSSSSSSPSSSSLTAAMGSSPTTGRPARPPRSPPTCPSSQQRRLLPTPPPAGAAGLRALRRCISAPADRTPDVVGEGGGLATLPSSPRLSVRARAAMIEGRSGSCDSSPWSSPPASRASSSRCLFPVSTRDSWSGDDSSISGDDTERSEDGSMDSSPRTSCSGGSLLRSSWGRSRSGRGSISGDGVSLLPFARASQHGAYGSPCKPNMPRIQGL